jgi:VWFA-related protein
MRKLLLGIPAAFIILGGPFLGRDRPVLPGQQEQTQLRHEVKVTVKLIQVYVTDKKGNPVLDLSKDDFLVFDEGKEQKITEFERHVLSRPSPEEEAPSEATETATPPARELMPRKFFLLFDFAFNNGIGIEKARKAALHFMDTQIQTQDEIGLLSYSAIKSLTLHENLTTDHKSVRQAVSRIGMEQIAGRAESFEEQYWRYKANVNPVDASSSGSVWQNQETAGSLWLESLQTSVNEQTRQEAKTQVFNFATKMVELAKAFRYIPGHKYILLLSSGVPHSLVYGVQTPYHKIGIHEWGEFWLQQKFEDMLKELSAANCTIYALDTQDLTLASGSDQKMQGASILQKMTSATGGKYFGNINSYERHIEKIQDLTGCYYVLGYYVDDKWDGAYRKIKVEVSRPGCNVLAQRGYFNPKPFKEYNDLERMLHLVDLALNEEPLFQTPLRFPLQVVPCAPDGKANLCLAAQVPLDKIREIMTGSVEMVTVIFDENEDIVVLKKSQKKVSGLSGERVSLGGSFSLPPGTYKCRLIIRNLETGKGAVASATAVIPNQ